MKASGGNLLNSCSLLVASFTARRYFRALYSNAVYSECITPSQVDCLQSTLKQCLSLLTWLLSSLLLIKILIVWRKRPSSSFPGVCRIASDIFSGFSCISIFLTVSNCWELCAEQKYLKWLKSEFCIFSLAD